MRRLRYWLGLALCSIILVGQLANSSSGPSSTTLSANSIKLQATLQHLLTNTRSDLATTKLLAHRKLTQVGRPTPELKDGKVRVVVEAQTPADLVKLRSVLTAGQGQVETIYGNYLQAWVPLSELESLSARPEVRFVRMPVQPILDQGQGSFVSEGVPLIGSAKWNDAGLDGRGVKIGILDPGFRNIERLVGRELPTADRVFTRSFRRDGQMYDSRNPSSHGTAVTEVINDVAPGATYYPTAFSTDVEFRQAVDYLMLERHVDVISTSVSFISGCATGPGIFEPKVAEARRNGALWTTSAGNNADSYYQGKWSDDDGNRLHNFKDTDEKNTLDMVLEDYTYPNGTRVATFVVFGYFSWEANCTSAGDDYEVVLFDEQGREIQALDRNGVGQITDWLWRPGVPIKIFLATLDYPAGEVGKVKKISYGIRQLRRGAPAGTLEVVLRCCTIAQIKYAQKEGSIGFFEPNVSPNAMTVGAFHHAGDKCPRVFCPDGSSLLVYSSRGPTKDGRIKPDITAPTHVSTSTYGRYTGDGPRDNLGFTGTSAAQPHVAGAAALVKQAFPTYTPEQLQQYLESHAEDRGAPGKDNDWGAGALLLGKVPAKPAAATELQTTARSAQEVVLSWKDNADNEDGYKIERRLQNDPSSSYTELAKTGANITTYADTTVSPETSYCYRVKAFNGNGESEYTQESCILTLATNRPPLANAGLDQTVTAGATVQLDASQSSDPDGDKLSYSWRLASVPIGSQAQLSDPTSINPTFVADVAGEYVAELIVTDGKGGQSSARVKITAQAPPAPVIALDTQRLEFQATKGGSNPDSKTIQISNTGGGALNWAASTEQPWIKLSPANDRASPSSTLTVTIEITGLDAGVYEGRITIAAPDANNSPQVVKVVLQISNP